MWLFTAVLPILLLGDGHATTPAKPRSPWDAAIVIGASASAGFQNDDAFGKHPGIAAFLDAMLGRKPDQTQSLATAMFFTNPTQIGKSMIDAAVKADPTLVVGVDFLFWYAYGDVKADSERLAHLEDGLRLLERFTCPVVVATLPDMSGAIGSMLSITQVPAVDVLDDLNERIEAWCKARKNVVLIDLALLLEKMREHEPITVRGKSPAKDAPLLQDDKLHPTLDGLAIIALQCMDALARNKVALPSDVLWDPAELVKAVKSAAPRAPAGASSH
ncbi:MAG: hypothetical protein U1E76_07230 [Planctomycetota bacterium]